MLWSIKVHNINPEFDCSMEEFSVEVNKMLEAFDKITKIISITDARYQAPLEELRSLIIKDMNIYLMQQNIGRFEILLKFAERIFPEKDPNLMLWQLADQVFHFSLRLPVSETIIRDASMIGAQINKEKDLNLVSMGYLISALVALIRMDFPKVLRNLIESANINILVDDLFEGISGLFNFIQVPTLIKDFVNFVKRVNDFMQQPNYGEKVQKAAQFIERYPSSILGYAMMATLLMDHKKFNEALVYAEKICEINNVIPTSFLLKGAILDQLGRLDEIAELIEKALALNPAFLSLIEPTYFPNFSKTKEIFKYKIGNNNKKTSKPSG
ncbi:MAG: hypothetical protein RBG13Loki_1952 [Promethearchaeota archaeon CR_4]|nr:MAG: hypothetical protein RBG13Loki_1952 [Candidatus Lokiarchaeota archaeon CR_4]